MPQQEGGKTPSNPTVRRASVLPAVAAEPGSALERLAKASGGSAADGDGRPAVTSAADPAGAPVTETGTAPASPAPAPADRAREADAQEADVQKTGTQETGTQKTDAQGTDAQGAAAQQVPSRTASEPEAAAVTDPPSAVVVGMPSAAAGSAVRESGRTAADDVPNGRPRKPVLAAAAIAGAVLISVPLLLVTGSDDDRSAGSDRAEPVGGTVLQGDGPAATQGAGGYATAPPSATPEKTGTAPEDKPAKKTEAAAQPRTTPEASAASPSVSPSPKTEKKAAAVKPKATPGRSLPQGANFDTTTKVLVKNVMTGMCVDVPAYGKGTVNGPVNQFTCDRSGDNQLWDLVVAQNGAGPSGADLFTIRNSKDGYCLDLGEYGGRPAGTPVSEFHCDGSTADNQLWYLDKKSAGKFWIRNYASGNRCLDVSGYYGVGGKDARLTIFDCNLKDDHLWSFS